MSIHFSEKETREAIEMYLHDFPAEIIGKRFKKTRAGVYLVLQRNGITPIQKIQDKEERSRRIKRTIRIRKIYVKMVWRKLREMDKSLMYGLLDFLLDDDIWKNYLPHISRIWFRNDHPKGYQYFIVEEKIPKERKQEFRHKMQWAFLGKYHVYFAKEWDAGEINEEQSIGLLMPPLVYDANRYAHPWDEAESDDEVVEIMNRIYGKK